jgi:hypothetical protein
MSLSCYDSGLQGLYLCTYNSSGLANGRAFGSNWGGAWFADSADALGISSYIVVFLSHSRPISE